MKNINIIDDSKSPLSYNGEYIEELSTVVLGLKKFSILENGYIIIIMKMAPF